MSKILILGYNPPLLVGSQKVDAANYRTWQFLQPLIAEGHDICFCVNDQFFNSQVEIPKDWSDHVTYRPIKYVHRGWKNKLQTEHDQFNPDCILAINFDMCLYSSKLITEKPIWMDIYGDYLTIIQAACFRSKSDRGLQTSIDFVRRVLQKGDIYSVCGTPQEHLLVGELAMSGRLNFKTFGYKFTQVILPGAINSTNHQSVSVFNRSSKIEGILQDDFIVLWCGGYNTWTDVDTLYKGLEWAISQEPKIKFVSVGGSTYQASDNVYEQLKNSISASKRPDRYILLGWQPWDEIPQYYNISQIGLNIDAMHYETIYGTRTRLLEMVSMGLPLVTSLGTEISYWLKDHGCALTFNIGDWRELGEAILKAARNKDLLDTMVASALTCANTELSFSSTVDPLLKWVKNPTLAPDKSSLSSIEKVKAIEYKVRSKLRGFLWDKFGKA